MWSLSRRGNNIIYFTTLKLLIERLLKTELTDYIIVNTLVECFRARRNLYITRAQQKPVSIDNNSIMFRQYNILEKLSHDYRIKCVLYTNMCWSYLFYFFCVVLTLQMTFYTTFGLTVGKTGADERSRCWVTPYIA